MKELTGKGRAPLMYDCLPQIAAVASTEPALGHGEARSQELYLSFSHAEQGARHIAIFGCFSQVFSRELDWKWSSWDMNWRPCGTSGGFTCHTTVVGSFNLFSNFFLRIYFLFERAAKNEGGREKGICYLLVYSLVALTSVAGLGGIQEPETSSMSLIGPQNLGRFLLLSQVDQQTAEWEAGQLGLKPVLLGGMLLSTTEAFPSATIWMSFISIF